LLDRVTPMDASSPIDMMGLGIILAVSVYFTYSLIAAPVQPGDLEPASIGALIVNVITFAALGYFAVGLFVHRTPRQATSRLGLRVPHLTEFVPTKFESILANLGVSRGNTLDRILGYGLVVFVGVAAVIPAFLLSFIGSLLTVAFQPEVLDSLTETTQDLTSGIQTPLGALVLGASTGIGEELLFRGAIQPRFGIILTSALWALLHTQYQFSFVILGLFGIGILFGLIRKYVGTTAVVIAHAVYNIAVVSLQTIAT
ncbi:MAG: CPBP family intramembrane glutamic endopeptidase, partial [Thermomicrobiales bacterium]